MPSETRWCFTLNNYIKAEEDALFAADAKYMVAGYEVAPSTQTPHLQGYVVFNKRVYLKSLQALSPRAHWEMAKLSSAVNVEYCKKGGAFREVGTIPSGSKAKDWSAAKLAAAEGRFAEIDPEMMIRYYSSLKYICRDEMKRPGDLLGACGVWIHGPPGVGKSWLARAVSADYYVKNSSKWWDGYRGQADVIFDDVDHRTPLTPFKHYADKYPFVAEVKGSSIYCRPERIIVTSNYTIEELVGDDDKLVAALKRRFTFWPVMTRASQQLYLQDGTGAQDYYEEADDYPTAVHP